MAAAGYVGLVTGACPLDLGFGRRVRPLGSQLVDLRHSCSASRPVGAGTRLAYQGEIGADLWGAGQRWCALVARCWEQTVAASLAAIKTEAERRASSAAGARGSSPDQPPPPTGR